MPINLGSAAISSLAVGSAAVSKVCLGSVQLWPACTPSALLLHFDGSNGSTSITDSSANAAAATAYGSAAISTSQSKFGGSSLYLDGSSSGRVVVTDYTSGAFSFSGDFTVEAWVFPVSAANYRTIATRYNGSNDAWIFRFDGNGLDLTSVAWYAGAATGAYYTFAATIALNQWHHVAITRQGTDVKCFLNGTQIGTTQTNSGVMTGGSAGTMIGASDQSGFEFPFDGYIEDLRIVDGLAVYQGNFIAPVAAAASCATVAPALPAVTLDYLVVAGGGSGGIRGGGGGGGGYREGTGYAVAVGQSLAVTIGAGAASVSANPYYDFGNNGSDSTFGTITSTGGGGGGGLEGNGTLGIGGPGMVGQNGGSGGGGGVGWYASGSPGSGNTPATTPSQGNNGGTGVNVGSAASEDPGGGGGAGYAGQDGGANGANVAGNGGLGGWSTITGSGAYYAGGGGGGCNPGNTPGSGGSGGGGGGSGSGAAGDGTANTGGGGGGCSYNSGDSSGNGGSGVVVLRFNSSHTLSVSPGLSYSSTTSGSDSIYTFTAGSDTISFTS